MSKNETDRMFLESLMCQAKPNQKGTVLGESPIRKKNKVLTEEIKTVEPEQPTTKRVRNIQAEFAIIQRKFELPPKQLNEKRDNVEKDISLLLERLENVLNQ